MLFTECREQKWQVQGLFWVFLKCAEGAHTALTSPHGQEAGKDACQNACQSWDAQEYAQHTSAKPALILSPSGTIPLWQGPWCWLILTVLYLLYPLNLHKNLFTIPLEISIFHSCDSTQQCHRLKPFKAPSSRDSPSHSFCDTRVSSSLPKWMGCLGSDMSKRIADSNF